MQVPFPQLTKSHIEMLGDGVGMKTREVVGIIEDILVLIMTGVEVVIFSQSKIPFPRSMHSWLGKQGFGEQGFKSISQNGPV